MLKKWLIPAHFLLKSPYSQVPLRIVALLRCLFQERYSQVYTSRVNLSRVDIPRFIPPGLIFRSCQTRLNQAGIMWGFEQNVQNVQNVQKGRRAERAETSLPTIPGNVKNVQDSPPLDRYHRDIWRFTLSLSDHPIVIPGRAKQLCAEEHTTLNTLRILRGKEGPHPWDSSFPEPRASSRHTPIPP